MSTATMLPTGTRVKHSPDALRPKRDAWLGEGQPSRKAMYRRDLDHAAARRGVITAVSHNGYTVQWDDTESGYVYSCLSYMVEEA